MKLPELLARLPEMGHKLRTDVSVKNDLWDCMLFIEQIPTMLEQARREAFEEAAKVMCVNCRDGLRLWLTSDGVPCHIRDDGDIDRLLTCSAINIRRKLAEQPKEQR